MRKSKIAALFAVMILSALMLAGCGKSEFGMTENTEKLMTITAEKADKGDFFMVGTLVVADGEQVVITPNLTKGSVRVELFGAPEEQSIEEVPEFDGEPDFSLDVKGTDESTATVGTGSYMLKATCIEKATGTVQLEVKPAE